MPGNFREYEITLHGKTRIAIVSDIASEIDGIAGRKIIFFPKSMKKTVVGIGFSETDIFGLNDGEELKSFSGIGGILEVLMNENLSRGDTVIALGGGSITDAVGYAASIFKRGVRLINIPTTLLGMVDAAIGGKTGINFMGKKNMLGCFYFPTHVLAYLPFLATLPENSYRDGLAEMVKYGFIMDSALINDMINNSNFLNRRDVEFLSRCIFRSMEDKMSVVIRDPMEMSGLRSILNFGHTIGHAIESATNYGITHGSAVSVGMAMETEFAEEAGYISGRLYYTVVKTLRALSLPSSPRELPQPVEAPNIREAMAHDKKSNGDHILMPVLESIGHANIQKIPMKKLEEFVDSRF